MRLRLVNLGHGSQRRLGVTQSPAGCQVLRARRPPAAAFALRRWDGFHFEGESQPRAALRSARAPAALSSAFSRSTGLRRGDQGAGHRRGSRALEHRELWGTDCTATTLTHEYPLPAQPGADRGRSPRSLFGRLGSPKPGRALLVLCGSVSPRLAGGRDAQGARQIGSTRAAIISAQVPRCARENYGSPTVVPWGIFRRVWLTEQRCLDLPAVCLCSDSRPRRGSYVV